jgi:DGQHR domain-containing protein
VQQMTGLNFSAIRAQQSAEHVVLTFAARARDVLAFAAIDRIGRDAQGELRGFQRPQVAAHIREIQDYLEKPDSVLPNAIVVAFTEGVQIQDVGDGVCQISIDVTGGPTGLVVDGQQRLTALSHIERDFQVFVSALVCKDEAELRRQFVLINNTRPLPKSLIYELLPTVDDLPARLNKRSRAAELTAQLNFRKNSSLHRLIKMHTQPDGVIADTVIQRIFMESLSDGVMRGLIRSTGGERACVDLVSNFFQAAKHTFKHEWEGQTPTTSRLRHGAGILAMGAVMEILAERTNARTAEEFEDGLACLLGKTHWTAGFWDFDGEVRRWNSIQNINRDIALLTHHLTSIVKADLRAKRRALPAPLLQVAAE